MSGKTTSRVLESVDSRSRHLVQRLQKLQDIGTQLSAEQDLTKLLDLILRESFPFGKCQLESRQSRTRRAWLKQAKALPLVV